jgi:hypothetical protein
MHACCAGISKSEITTAVVAAVFELVKFIYLPMLYKVLTVMHHGIISKPCYCRGISASHIGLT